MCPPVVFFLYACVQELFTENFVESAYENTEKDRRKVVTYNDAFTAVREAEQRCEQDWTFLVGTGEDEEA